MISNTIKYFATLAKYAENTLVNTAIQVEPHRNMAKRTEIAIFKQHTLPKIIAYIDALPLFNKIMQYNPALTNGGPELEEYPLVKLLHIGLKMVEKQEGNVEFWKKYENYIKLRLHRCTVQENMRLLYIMLKIWPIYRFNASFISSICLGLKKQLNIMNDEELKVLLRVTAAGIQSRQHFEGGLLLALQASLLSKVIGRWEKMQPSNRNTSVQGLYSWLSLSSVLSLRNNPQQTVIEDKVVSLANVLSTIFSRAVTNLVALKQPSHQNLFLMLQVLLGYESVYRYYNNSKNQALNWSEQFSKLKLCIIGHSTHHIARMMQQNKLNLTALNAVVSLINKDVLENLLYSDQQERQIQKEEIRYPRINHLVQKAIMDKKQNEILSHLQLLCVLVEKEIMSWSLAKLHYETIQLNSIKENSLSLCSNLIEMQLYLYLFSNVFKPRHQSHQLITDFLDKNEANFHKFDWMAFNYLRLVITHTRKQSFLPSSSQHASQQTEKKTVLQSKLLQKIIDQAKITDKKQLIQQEKTLILTKNLQINSLKKFFIEVKLHQLEILKPIMAPFQRLPHFANPEHKVVLNALKEDEINSPPVLLQKRLMNELGWKVINVKMPFFVSLTTGERVNRISETIKQQSLITAKNNLDMLQ